MTTATITREQAAAELIRRNPIKLACAINHSYDPSWVHQKINTALCNVVSGDIKRLIITKPPRHGKSELCSRTFPPWYLGNDGDKPRSIIAASYSDTLARKFGRAGRNITRSNIFSEVFDTGLNRTLGTSVTDWTLDNGNAYSASGVGGGITGLGASVFLVDDPIKNRQQADSPTYRENLKDWFKEVAVTRLTPDGAIIIIMTRWHYDDLVGWLLEEAEEKWTVLKFPAIQTDHDLDKRPYDKRKPGEALWPTRYSKKQLQNIEEELGPLAFKCLYQQDPTVEGGTVLNINDLVQDFDLNNLHFDDADEMWMMTDEGRVNINRLVSSWDTAFEKTKTADFSVGTMWADSGKAYYLVDVIRGRWRFPQLKEKMKSTYKRWKEDSALIEAKASGKDLLYELREFTDMPIQPVTPVTDKVSRAAAVSGRFQAGRVHVPKNAPWLRVYFTELEHFPKVTHDDQVDSTTQAIRWLSRYGGLEAE